MRAWLPTGTFEAKHTHAKLVEAVLGIDVLSVWGKLLVGELLDGLAELVVVVVCVKKEDALKCC